VPPAPKRRKCAFHGYGLLYLPLMVIRDQGLLEKHAKAMGLGDVKTKWVLLDGGNVINDAMLAGNLDIAGTGAPGFVTLWSKAHGIPRSEVVGLGALSTAALAEHQQPQRQVAQGLHAQGQDRHPRHQDLAVGRAVADGRGQDLRCRELRQAGPVDGEPVTPEAMASLVSGKTEITAHFTSPPFSYQEAKAPGITRVLNSTDVLGHITIDVASL
jgi:NitT/TauT family transport system substrate-binding protein